LSRLAPGVFPARLNRADFLRLDFVRERGEPPFGVRLAAIALVMLIVS
jgi:hypothetical protein